MKISQSIMVVDSKSLENGSSKGNIVCHTQCCNHYLCPLTSFCFYHISDMEILIEVSNSPTWLDLFSRAQPLTKVVNYPNILGPCKTDPSSII